MSKQELKEQKHIECEKRKRILTIAGQYTKDDLSWLEKNSNITNEIAVNYIKNMHFKNDTLRRLFSEKSQLILQK